MSGDACNIGLKGQKRRERVGMLFLVLAGFTSAILIAFQIPSLYRVIVFPLFGVGFISLLQAARKVCVMNAYKKTIEME
ncbi:MAG: hypothetical protein AABX02_05195 [archaeon]